ncbi:MAG: translation elongation factor Ts [Blastocatellia bacterium]|nr:translation elongation factor Ts [Blastocatellia bacterium]MBL8195257.1 translation elongation factor Ts [Blastocatellia bacterium]MBN8724059.1 translation elongation factor Ts [Acidobacteriota bacterium]
MAEITASAVKSLREKTGAGMMECKAALNEAQGDEEKAMEILRKRGLASAKKKEGRVAAEGVVGSYIHMGGKVGVLVEVNCETDFVARGEVFQQFVKDVAMHICAAEPRYVSKEDVPAEVLEKERVFVREQALTDEKNKNKPEAVIEKIVEGRMSKFYAEVCLLEQQFIKDNEVTVSGLLQQMVSKIGENIRIRRFVRFKMGEGLEKKKDDFASEVAAALQ